MQNCHFLLCTKNFALPVSTAVYKILYQAVNAGSAVYKIIFYTALYNISRCHVQSRFAPILIQTSQGCIKCVQPGNNFVQLQRIFVLSRETAYDGQTVIFSCQWTLCMLLTGSNLSEFNVFYLFLDV